MPIADLTGTSWKFGNTILPTTMDSNNRRRLSGGIVGTNYTFTAGNSGNAWVPLGNFTYGAVFLNGLSSGIFDDLIQNSNGSWSVYNNDDEYEVEALGNEITLEITGGADTTNASVISFYETYGTNVTPAPTSSNKISVGSLPLSKMFVGSAEVSKAILNGVTLYEKKH